MRRFCWLAAVLVMELAGQEPAAVRLSLSSAKGDFYLGEAVLLQMRFTSSAPKAFVAYSASSLSFEEFVVDRTDGVEDPLRGNRMGIIGGVSGPALLSDKALSIELFLNEVVRFRRPGTYRVHAVSQRVGRVTHPEHLDFMRLYAPTETTHIVVTSDEFTLKIHAAPPGWAKEQIAIATKFIDGPPAVGSVDYEARQRAVRTLRYLNTPEAARELAARMNNGSGVTYRDLRDTSYPSQVLAVLERRLTARDEAIDSEYLTALSEVSETVADGPMRPYPKDEASRKTWQDEWKPRIANREAKYNEYTRRLIAALPSKEPVARAESVVGLFGAAHRARQRPDWTNAITTELIAHFRLLPARTQENLLWGESPELKAPAMLPVLRELYDSPRGSQLRPGIQEIALRRIYTIAPDEGRRLILEEIRHPQHHIDSPATLAMLPDATLPEMDDVLANAYETGERNADWLVLRYGTAAIAGRIKEAYEKRARADAFAGVIVFYFLKHQPAFGQQELRRSMSVSGGPPLRYDIAFQISRYGAWAMSPGLEHVAIELLSSSSVPIKKGAAETLGKYGSSYAKEPLWHTMEFFRSWWKGREEELNQAAGEEGRGFERTLITALAQADAWVLTKEELAKLVELCSSPSCKDEIQRRLPLSKTPVPIEAGNGQPFPSSIGPYEVRSDEQFRKRLSQYPAGTAFHLVWYDSGNETRGIERTREQIAAAVRESGHRLAP